jgi:hypothetical protein
MGNDNDDKSSEACKTCTLYRSIELLVKQSVFVKIFEFHIVAQSRFYVKGQVHYAVLEEINRISYL